MKRISIKSAFCVAHAEMAFLLQSPPMIVVPVFLCFIYTLAVQPLKEVAQLMGGKLNVLEVFVSICNSNLLAILVSAVFLVLMSSYPAIRGNTIFFLPRCGKHNWVLGQVMFLMAGSFIYMFVIAAFSIVIQGTGSVFSNEWSDATLKFFATYPELSMSAGANMLTTVIYSQMAPVPAFVHTFLLVYGNLLLMCGIMLMFTVLNRKRLGFILVYGFLVLGIVFSVLKHNLRWAFSVSHSILDLHFHLYLRKPIMPVWMSYVYEYGGFLVLCLIALLSARKMKLESK